MEGGVVSSFEIEHNYSDPNTFYQQQFGEQIMYGDAAFSGQARYVQDMRFRNEVRTTTYEQQTTGGSRRPNPMRGFIGWIFESFTTVSLFGYTIRPWTDGMDVSKMGFIMRIFVFVFDFISRIFLAVANLAILIISILLIKFGI